MPAGCTNYVFSAAAEKTKSYTITQREITVNWNAPFTFTYDGEAHAPTAAAGDLAAGDTLTLTVTGAEINAGDYTATVAAFSRGNYKLTDDSTQAFRIDKANRAAPVLTPTDETYSGKNDGSIAGLSGDMEMSLTDDGTGFTAVTDTSGSGYAPGNYYFRYAEDANHYASPISPVTINAGPRIVITYMSDGAVYAGDTADYNDLLTAPADPQKDDFNFDGWFSDTAFTAKWDFTADRVTADLILYAKLTPDAFTITFDTRGGSYVAPLSLTPGAAVTAPADPTYNGYIFGGWMPPLPSVMPAENITLVAVWGKGNADTSSPVPYPVSYSTTAAVTAVPPNTTTSATTATSASGTSSSTSAAATSTSTSSSAKNTTPISSEPDFPEDDFDIIDIDGDETDTIPSNTYDDAEEETPEELGDIGADRDDDTTTEAPSDDETGYYLDISSLIPDARTAGMINDAAESIGLTANDELCWDIKLYRTVNGIITEQLHSSDEPLAIAIEIPSALRPLLAEYPDTARVIRIHEGRAEYLDCGYNSTTGMLTFLSDKFSVYSLVFKSGAPADSDDNPVTDAPFTDAWIITALSGFSIFVLRRKKA